MRLDEIAHFWRRHERARFPESCLGDGAPRPDLALVEADAALCVRTFLGNGGALDAWRRSVLAKCDRKLAEALPLLEGDDLAYFAALKRLTESVMLHAMAHRPARPD
jgi:hypothetical protein